MTTNNPTVAIGVPTYGTKKKLNFKLADGENIYRILPPLFSLAAEGVWAVYQSVHWGSKGVKGAKSFQCIQKTDYKTKMVKVQCPECDQIAQKLQSKNNAKEKFKAEGKTELEITDLVKPHTDWLYAHNLNKKWFVNAMTQDGKIGRLAIPHKMYVQLQLAISALVEKGLDPIGVSGGVWFNLVRTGLGNQTTHSVGVVEESMDVMVEGKKIRVSTKKPAPLTEEVLSRLQAEASDLKEIARKLSYEDISRITNSGYDPEVVDQVFSRGEVFGDEGPSDDEPDLGVISAPMPSMTPMNRELVSAPVLMAPVVQKAVETNPAKEQLDAQMKALQEQMNKLQSMSTPTVAPTPAPAPAPATAKMPDTTAMSDEDFVKAFGFSVTK